MKTKIILIILICAILGVYLAASNEKSANSLVITPKDSSVIEPQPYQLDEINENKFMLSYVFSQQSTATAFSRHYVTLKGTNYSFPFVINSSGSFFTYDMQKNKTKAAILNEKAAFEIFGGHDISGNLITINGDKYVVSGVIDDYFSDESNIYIPASLMAAKLSEIIIPLDESRGVSTEYIKNELKHAGITDDYYNFTDNVIIINNIKNCFFAALEISFFCLTLLLMKKAGKRITKALVQVKNDLKSAYLKDFVYENKQLCIKAVADTAAIVAGLMLLVYLSMRLLDKYLLISATFDICRQNNYFIAASILLSIFAATALSAAFRLLAQTNSD